VKSRLLLACAALLIVIAAALQIRGRSGVAPVAVLDQHVAPAKPAGPRVVDLKVFPADINLATRRAWQAVVVQALYDNQTTGDVTVNAVFSIAQTGIARAERNVVSPVADGATELRVTFGERTVTIPVRVKDAAVEPPISFKRDVMPVFLNAGCNTGACHGSARGQDGFRLSLFGFDPDGDYYRLTRELSGRRINLALPQESLVLLKALGKVPHTGGQRIVAGSESADRLIRWLAAGAPKDPDDVPTPVALEVLPDRMVLEGEGATQQLAARVKYSDGTQRDVTTMAVFLSNNDPCAKVGGTGLITAGHRGEAFVMARYATFTVGAQVLVVPKGSADNFPAVAEYNYIDTHVDNKLRKMRIVPSDLCSDDAFIRRVCIDIVGLLPTRSEVDKFIADTDPKKREKLVDELLQRKEFVELWVMKWAELLQIRSTDQFSYKSALLYYTWLEEKIAANVPMNEIVHELLSATGSTFQNPPTNYYQVETDTLKVSENVAQVFMGMRLQCAQCHNHPFDRWTMNDYYSFAAFFPRIGRKPGEDPRETIVFSMNDGEVQHPVTKLDMQPRFLGGAAADVKDRDRRAALADWLTGPENPYFARNLANIVWAHFFGRGIIEPVDDVRVSNPASNPELLEALGQKFAGYKYDFRKLVRDICTSRTYQLATRTNPTNEQDLSNFSHATIRRIRAEVLLDCISEVTGTPNKFKGLPRGARAVQIADGNVTTPFLQTFGRATRETVCSCGVVMQPNLSQALDLLNGETVQNKIREGARIKKLRAEGRNPRQVVDELYVECLSRRPTTEEADKLLAGGGTDDALEDVFWALLNSKEFVFNH
jgi:hypothetical protein